MDIFDSLSNSIETESASINALPLAVPSFGDLDPEVWFKVFEIELTNRSVAKEDGKFSQLVPRLPKDHLSLIKHILLDDSCPDRYSLAKALILKDTRLSERLRIEQLLSKVQLGSKKPSALLREMRNLAGPQVHDSLLRELWVQRLPNYAQAILDASRSQDLDELAESADALYERLPQTFSLPGSSAPQPKCSCSHEEELRSLRATVERLSIASQSPVDLQAVTVAAVRQVLAELRPGRRRRSRQPSRRRNTSRRRSKSPFRTLCWYHRKFGDRAHHCIPPCSWKHSAEN